MRGHIAKEGSRYFAVVYAGVNPATGKETHDWHRGGKTRREAEKVLGEIIKRMHDGE